MSLYFLRRISQLLRVERCRNVIVAAAIPLTLQGAWGEEAAARKSPANGNDQPVITLEQAYDIALATDQSLRIAAIEIRRARLLPWSALAQLTPRVNASLNATTDQTRTTNDIITTTSTYGGGGSATSISIDNSRDAQITLEQPLLDLTAFPNYRYGKLSILAAKLQYRFDVRTVLFGVAKAYYTVLEDQALVAVNKETLDLADGQLKLAQIQYDVGAVSRIDVLRAESSVETSKVTLIQSQNTLEADRDTLNNILNLRLGGAAYRVEEPPEAPTDVGPFEPALGTAFALREDYQVSKVAIDQSIAKRSAAAAVYAPSVSATLSQDWSSDRTNSPSNSFASSWNAQIGVSIPIFDGGQRDINLADAIYQVDEKRLTYEQTAKTVEADVKNTWLTVHTLSETIVASRADLNANEQNYNDVENEYKAGAATSLDTLTALQALNTSRTTLTTELYGYQVALRDLQRAIARFQQGRVDQAASKYK